MSDTNKLAELIKKAKTKMWGKTFHSELERNMFVADYLLANGVKLPVMCKDCIHAVELDKHCDISRTAYRHCSLLRGDETKYVWHKYKKYYKDYSIVEPDDYCSYGELKEREGK